LLPKQLLPSPQPIDKDHGKTLLWDKERLIRLGFDYWAIGEEKENVLY